MKKRFSISILMILCLSVSSLFSQTPFTSPIQVVNGSDTISLTLGTAVCATADTNACAGESELPPVPPAGVFVARFV